MSNIVLPGTGETIATDTVSGEKVPLGKLLVGGAGAGTMVSEANPLPVIGLEELVALGLVPGWSIMRGMGERESMTVVTAGEDICRMNQLSPLSSDPARLLTPSTAGEALSIYCESGDDAAAGTGAQEVRIHYIDTSYAQQTQDVATNGGTKSTGITDAIFVNDVYTIDVGTDGVAAGNIHVFKTGTTTSIYNFIIAGGNKSLVPHRMVPDGYNLLLKGWHVEEGQGKRIVFRIRSTDMHGVLNEGVFCFKDIHYCKQTPSGWLPLNETIPARSILKVTGWHDAGGQPGAEGSCKWWGYLVAD